MAFDLWSATAGAAVGAITTTWNRWWQYRRDNWLSRVDYFCEKVDELAHAATEYWLEDINEGQNLSSERARIRAMECKILGLLATIDGVFPSFAHRIAFTSRESLKECLLQFADTVAGGNFQVADRSIDSERALTAQTAASDIIVLTREALDRALTLKGLYTYFLELPAYRN